MTQPRPRRRRIPGLRWWHKWVGITIGTILFIWVVSGLIMLLPQSEVARRGDGNVPVDWSRVTVTPAQAAQAALAATGGRTVQRIEFKRVRESMMYLVRLDGGRRVLIDGTSAAPVRISTETAGAMALEALPGAKVLSAERSNGPHASWRVYLDDPGRTVAVVAEETGEVVRTQRSDRIKTAIGHSLHVFDPLRDLPGGDGLRRGALWVTSIIAIFSILTGFYLGLPRRWRGWA